MSDCVFAEHGSDFGSCDCRRGARASAALLSGYPVGVGGAQRNDNARLNFADVCVFLLCLFFVVVASSLPLLSSLSFLG